MRCFVRLRELGCSVTISMLVACSAVSEGLPKGEVDGPEPEPELARGSQELGAGATVTDAINAGCSTSSVQGLSEQIVAQMNCLVKDAMAALPNRPNLTKSAATFPYLQAPARDALVSALDENPGKTLPINSMFRTVAQQYLLYQWGAKKTCGVALAAKPGSSNHESGLALDTSQYSSWKSALEARGFKWFGSADKVHFDYVGPGKTNLKGVDVKAFQILWNRNHPNDVIAEDGIYGPQTATRLAKSPANGFATGADCGSVPLAPSPAAPSPASCTGSCGSSEPAPNSAPACYCDAACAQYSDCCSDYQSLCNTASAPASGTSCSGQCQSSSPAPGSSPACYCDPSCVTYGDCCQDAAAACGY